jgi:mannose-1-phosphate guanylyltransferase
MTGSDRDAPRALLLTAGLGTRLRPLTYLRAKPAVPINGVPLVLRAIDWLSRAGTRDLVLNLHHRPASIAAIVGDGRQLGVRVRYSWEQPVLGSAGGPRRALPLLVDGRTDEDFLIVNGDTLTDLELGPLLARHRASGALVTMALIENPSPDRYGGVRVSDDGWVTSFSAAAGRGAEGARGGFHFIGVQVARARAFTELTDGVPAESVNALYPRLIAAAPHAVAAHVTRSSFLDIGTPRDCLETSLSLAQVEGPRLVGARTQIDPSAHLVRTIVWDDATIGKDVALRDCLVGDGARIPDGAAFEGCALVPADGPPSPGERVEGKLLVKNL